MDPNLLEETEEQNIRSLYESIRSDPYIFEETDQIPFAQTPLHEAASRGQTRLAMLIMNLKPSLGKRLNLDCQSPLHLALLNGHFETVKRLISLDKDLIRVKGRDCFTPLHHAAETDDRFDILADFLSACPESVEDLNVQCETALLIAAKNRNVRALQLLMRHIVEADMDRVKDIKDWKGNTIVHIAVSTSQPDVCPTTITIVSCVVQRGCIFWSINERNLQGATALDVAKRLDPGSARTKIERTLRWAGAFEERSFPACGRFFLLYLTLIRLFWRDITSTNRVPMEVRNAFLVVAALITTVTFQAVLKLTPPSGALGGNSFNATISMPTTTSLLPTTNISYIQGTIFPSNSSSGVVPQSYGSFYASNNTSFLTSIMLILLLIRSHGPGFFSHLLGFALLTWASSFWIMSSNMLY